MKHAGKEALAKLQPVLEPLRKQRALVERTPGSFYLRSMGFLHFHEDPSGFFADLKEDLVSFSRYRVSTRVEQQELLGKVNRCLKGSATATGAKGS